MQSSLPQFDPERAPNGMTDTNQLIKDIFDKIDYLCIAVFTIEVVLRLLCTPTVSSLFDTLG